MRRNFKKLIKVFEDRPSYALGVREYVADSDFAAEWMAHAETVASYDPSRGSALASTGVCLTFRNGNRCLKVRAVALCAFTLKALGHLELSERFFPFTFQLAEDCTCCLSLLYRQLARLRSAQRLYAKAFTLAELSIDLAPNELALGLSLAARALVLFDSGDFTGAAKDFRRSIDLLPQDKKPAAFHGYAFSLARSKEPSLVLEAGNLLPKVEEEFKGVRGQSLFRAKLAWLKGSVYSRQAEVVPDRFLKRRGLRREGAYHLDVALGRFLRMKEPLRLEIEACTADLVAVEARFDRYRVPEIFQRVLVVGRDRGLDLWLPELSRLRGAVEYWAEARKPGAAAKMWAALKALRDATVEAGATPPLVPYMDPAAAL